VKKSPLAPYNAARWVECPASHEMSKRFPKLDEIDPIYAQEGIAAHWVAEQIMAGNTDLIGKSYKNGVYISEEFYRAVQVYTDQLKTHPNIQLEDKLNLDTIYPGMYGYCDAWSYDADKRLITIYDFKFGRGIVEPKENWQMICYAAALMDKLGINGIIDQYTNVQMYIVQPRAHHEDGPVRKWTCRASKLRAHITVLANVANDIMRGKYTYRVGRHCKYCPGRYACKELQNNVYDDIDYVDVTDSAHLDGNDLGVELSILEDAKELIECRLSGIKAQIEHKLKRGGQIAGYELKESMGRLKWDADCNSIAALGEMMGIDLVKPKELITPTQAKAKGLDEDIINTMASRESGGFKLAKIDMEKIKQIFGG